MLQGWLLDGPNIKQLLLQIRIPVTKIPLKKVYGFLGYDTAYRAGWLSGDALFKSRPGYRLSSLRFTWFSLSLQADFGVVSPYGHDHFLSNYVILPTARHSETWQNVLQENIPCISVDKYERFGGTCCLYPQDRVLHGITFVATYCSWSPGTKTSLKRK